MVLTETPCNVCDICRCISEGNDIDVLEIDGASNRGIDEVRNIRQNVNYAPSRTRYKIYIIDEVHMLTREAFNALLKTLEEPPAHVKFILPQQQSIAFLKPSSHDVSDSILRIFPFTILKSAFRTSVRLKVRRLTLLRFT